MRYLNPSDIRQALSYEEMMAAVEEAFLLFAQGRCAMADRSALTQGSTTLATMPCFAGGYAATKLLASCPDNPRRGLPSLYGTVLLSQGDTGQPVALLEGNTLTALRTGAIGGLAAKHLAREDAATAGLVGCGIQGLHQLTFLCQVRPIRTVYLYNHGSKDLGPFCRQLEAMVAPKPLAIETCPDPDTLLAKSDIVVTATPAKAPLFADDPLPGQVPHRHRLLAAGHAGDSRGHLVGHPGGLSGAPLRLPGERRPVPAPGLRRSKTGGPALLRGLPSGQAGRRCAAPPPHPVFQIRGHGGV